MIPKKVESEFIVKVVSSNISLAEIISIRSVARRLRKSLVAAILNKENIEYYKFQEVEF
jgi:tRNA splicing endonuclease